MKKNDFEINCSPEEFLQEFVLDDCREEAKKGLNTMLKRHFFNKLVYETWLNRKLLGFSIEETDIFLNKFSNIEYLQHPVNKFYIHLQNMINSDKEITLPNSEDEE